MNPRRKFSERTVFSIFSSLAILYVCSIIYTLINIGTGESSSPFDLENLWVVAEVLSGAIVKPTDLLAAAGVLATLYVATALASRAQLSVNDVKRRIFIENGASNLAHALFIYSLFCMLFYFFQEDRRQLSYGDFIFYLAPAFLCYFISSYPPIDISSLQEQKKVNKKRVNTLENLSQEINKNGQIIPYSYLHLSRRLIEKKEFSRLKAYLHLAKNKWKTHIALFILTIPALTVLLPIGVVFSALIRGRSLVETFENFPWSSFLLPLPFYLVQAFSLSSAYDHVTHETKSEILGRKKSTFPFLVIFLQVLIGSLNILIFSEMIPDNFADKNLLFKITICIIFLTNFIGPAVLWHIYKKYRKFIQVGVMGETFKVAVLNQALQNAKKESESLDQKIKDIQSDKVIAEEPGNEKS